MFQRKFMFILAVLALAGAALACGGSTPIELGELPAFPETTELQVDDLELAQILADTIQEAAGQEGVNAEIRVLQLPAETGFEDLRSFYAAELESADWTSDPGLDQRSDAFSSAGWTRGALGSEQAVIVGYARDPVSGTLFYILGLFSE